MAEQDVYYLKQNMGCRIDKQKEPNNYQRVM